jgi:arsenate reductase
MTKVYAYSGCGTCRTALKFLRTHGIAHESVPVRDQPPTKAELRRMLDLQGGTVRRLFNTSGVDYRALGLASTLPTMPVDAALDLLAANGNLVKRPFLLTADGGTVGFDEDVWRRLLGIRG